MTVVQKSSGRAKTIRSVKRLKCHLRKHGSEVWADCLIAELKTSAGAETAHYKYINHNA